ncbi:MAG TPA: hypothetical protein VGM67_18110 [Gemmatimonadaceae bacterium]|jgi:hypothetical protein
MREQHNSRLGRSALLVAALAAFTVLAPSTARAQDASVKTAAQHAGLAAKAADLATVKKHMHHVLNCLEGKSGKDYDATAGDPCKGVGATSPNDPKIQEAVRLLNVGESLDSMAAAQHVAEATAAVLAEVK